MYWRIDKDHIADEGCDRTGHAVGHMEPGTKLYDFRLYDGDGELYYECRADREAITNDDHDGGIYSAYQWAMHDSGCTDLRLKLDDLNEIYPGLRRINANLAAEDGWVPVYG